MVPVSVMLPGFASLGAPSVPRFTSFSTTTRKVRVEVGSPFPSCHVISPIRVISGSSSTVADPTFSAELSCSVLKLSSHS